MDIVEKVSNFDVNVSLRFDNWGAFHELKQEVAAEIERLREIEKDWQAMRDERDAARTGYDNLLDENRGLVKLEAENERLRAENQRLGKMLHMMTDDADLISARLRMKAKIARAALSGKTEDDRNRADQA